MLFKSVLVFVYLAASMNALVIPSNPTQDTDITVLKRTISIEPLVQQIHVLPRPVPLSEVGFARNAEHLTPPIHVIMPPKTKSAFRLKFEASTELEISRLNRMLDEFLQTQDQAKRDLQTLLRESRRSANAGRSFDEPWDAALKRSEEAMKLVDENTRVVTNAMEEKIAKLRANVLEFV